MPKIYTKTGDKGETSLLGGKRVPKDNLCIEAYGTVDELNSFLGLTRSIGLPGQIDKWIDTIQHDLFKLGAELASDRPRRIDTNLFLGDDDIVRLEKIIDDVDATLPELRNFILPGGHPAAAMMHTARAVCRRAERCTARLSRDEVLRDIPLRYLNRLSDLLFVLARKVNATKKRKEVRWAVRKKRR